MTGDELVSLERLDAGAGVNAVWRLERGNAREGAYFKPINGIRRTVAYLFGHTRESVFVSEVAAYRLACALGEPFSAIVPPCVVRSVPEIDEHAPGSLTPERFDERREDVFVLAPEAVLRAAFFDALIANQDRSRANVLFDASREDFALIDHGFAFPREGDVVNASIFLNWRRRAGLHELVSVELDALGALTADDGLLGLRGYLEQERADALESRAARMLESGRLV